MAVRPAAGVASRRYPPSGAEGRPGGALKARQIRAGNFFTLGWDSRRQMGPLYTKSSIEDRAAAAKQLGESVRGSDPKEVT
jgi:hypothetical protein